MCAQRFLHDVSRDRLRTAFSTLAHQRSTCASSLSLLRGADKLYTLLSQRRCGLLRGASVGRSLRLLHTLPSVRLQLKAMTKTDPLEVTCVRTQVETIPDTEQELARLRNGFVSTI